MGKRPANRAEDTEPTVEPAAFSGAATEGLRFVVADSEAGVTGTIPRWKTAAGPVVTVPDLTGPAAGNSSTCRHGLGLGRPWSSCEPAGLRRTSSPGRRLSVVVHSTPAARQP
jgi:hypothetical protein